ncbi:DNA helicase RecQ [Abyssisolibacter fermentans]|uniref:DNA helicase RecQ n=1 Tax=Abyssisolibacter fermentans TaxID=1766203 RepID=UPI0008378587|nr:DNA helicase RecQ [Abyssisolibacter fermentans]
MDIYEVLKIYFGYEEFRDGQKEVIEAIINGRDVLGIMPTGGGKSLCYQLPAIINNGVTIVISPLIALMKDQVDSLKEIGIEATYINSTLASDEILDRLMDVRRGRYKIIYVAPERLNTKYFKSIVQNVSVELIAVDEAHCISQWGHDFRPSYLEIPKFIQSFNKRPVVGAYTATATKAIIKEIKELIGLQNPVELITSFDRPNLMYKVIKASNKFQYLKNYLNNNFVDNSGIIYCSTRKSVESVAKKLRERGMAVTLYHGGMEAESRRINQEEFTFNRARIIVATNAFGMGIDKPDVRFVIHYNMPQNMEAYYQEAGRAGRDGEMSECILMYSPSDVVKQKLLINNDNLTLKRQEILLKNLQYLIDYCHTNNCLRASILRYFNEEPKFEKCNNCGNCLDNSEMVDITLEAQKILSCIYRARERFGVNVIINILRGSKNKKILEMGLDRLSTYGIMDDYSTYALREMIMTLISKGFINITTDKFPILKLTATSLDVLKGITTVEHKKYLLKEQTQEKKAINKLQYEEYDEELFNKLREIRADISKEKNVPAFIIFHDVSLKEMATVYPQNRDEFLDINGVGIKKYEAYGDIFIEVIKGYKQKE